MVFFLITYILQSQYTIITTLFKFYKKVFLFVFLQLIMITITNQNTTGIIPTAKSEPVGSNGNCNSHYNSQLSWIFHPISSSLILVPNNGLRSKSLNKHPLFHPSFFLLVLNCLVVSANEENGGKRSSLSPLLQSPPTFDLDTREQKPLKDPPPLFRNLAEH